MKQAITPGRFGASGHSAQPSAGIPQPANGALHDPAAAIAPQGAAILRRRTNAILFVRRSVRCRAAAAACAAGRCHKPCRQSPAPASAAVGPHGDAALRGWPRASSPRAGLPPGMQSEGGLPKEDPGRRPPPSTSSPCPAWFSDTAAPFFAGAKLPSRNDSLHCNCWHSFNSLRNAPQMFNHTPCSSQSRSRRQQVEGCGYFSGKSCQRAPLRRIHRIPSRTRRLSIHGRPPCAAWVAWGARARSSSTALRSATDRTAPSALLRRC